MLQGFLAIWHATASLVSAQNWAKLHPSLGRLDDRQATLCGLVCGPGAQPALCVPEMGYVESMPPHGSLMDAYIPYIHTGSDNRQNGREDPTKAPSFSNVQMSCMQSPPLHAPPGAGVALNVSTAMEWYIYQGWSTWERNFYSGLTRPRAARMRAEHGPPGVREGGG